MTRIEFLNPDTLIRNPAFSHAVTVDGLHRVVYIGGQNAVDRDRNIVGKGDLQAQAGQVATNLEAVLAASGATVQNVVQWNIYIVQGQSPLVAFEVFRDRWGMVPNPPTVTLAFVSGLAHPDFLLEISGIAVVPCSEFHSDKSR